jgi:hypothetical protein
MDCFLHYRFGSNDLVKLLSECFKKNQIEFREIDNLILISSNRHNFIELATALYETLLPFKLSKSDYLYLYTSRDENNWFSIIIKKMGISKMYNISPPMLRK